MSYNNFKNSFTNTNRFPPYIPMNDQNIKQNVRNELGYNQKRLLRYS